MNTMQTAIVHSWATAGVISPELWPANSLDLNLMDYTDAGTK